MEELYSETYVKAKPTLKRTLIRVGLFVLLFVLLAAAMLLMNPLFLFVAIAADGAIILFMPKKNIAYEYVFVDGQIDFDCIIGDNKRKHKKRTDMDKIDLIAPIDYPELNRYANLPLTDFSSGYGKGDFIAIVRSDGGQERIKFTPDEKLIENMKYKGRSKIKC